MNDINTRKELNDALTACGGRALICFWKKACPGCMKVSKLIPLLEKDTVPLLGFDCSDGMEEAKALGINGTPEWVLYENSEKTDVINPAADRDELYAFLTERAGFSILSPVFEMALDEGEVYADQMQDAIVEIMFRSKDNGNDIIAASRLKILKAYVETPADVMGECLDAQIDRCMKRLRARMEQDNGGTEAQFVALETLPSLKDDLFRELAQVRKS